MSENWVNTTVLPFLTGDERLGSIDVTVSDFWRSAWDGPPRQHDTGRPCGVSRRSCARRCQRPSRRMGELRRTHALRHPSRSQEQWPPAVVVAATGHSDAEFTLRVYAKDARDEAAFVSDVLGRAAGAGIGQ